MINEAMNFLFSVIEASILLGLVGSLFPGRYNRTLNIVAFFISVISGAVAINQMGFNIFLRTLILIVFFILLCQILYEGPIHMKLFYLLFANYICVVSEVVFANFIMLLPDEKVNIILHDIKVETTVTIIIKALVILLGILFAKYFMKLKPKLPGKYWITLDLIFIIFIEILQLSMFIELKIKDIIPEYHLYCILMTIGILIISVYVFYFLGKICWVYEKQTEFELFKLRSSELEKIIVYQQQSGQEMKRIKHDINKNLTNISYLLEKEKITESVSYLDNITNVLNNAKEVISCGNYVIDAILNYRISLCNHKHILLELSIDQIGEFQIKPVDISAILDNLLDNSIEAVESLAIEKRIINIKIFSYKNNMVIVIKNPFQGKLEWKNNEIVTKKSSYSEHGYGLKSIKDTIERNLGTYKCYVDDNEFTTIVMLPFKERDSK